MAVIERIRRFVEGLRMAREGAVAVEFAIILPVMLIFYLGTYEGSQAIIAKRNVDTAAETVGGIVSRSISMDQTRLNNVLLVSDAIVGGLNPDALTITVTAVRVDSLGRATVDWSRRGTGPGLASGARYTMPPELATLRDTYFVFSTAEYEYTPNLDYGGLIGTMRFERTFSHRPRKGSQIPWS